MFEPYLLQNLICKGLCDVGAIVASVGASTSSAADSIVLPTFIDDQDIFKNHSLRAATDSKTINNNVGIIKDVGELRLAAVQYYQRAEVLQREVAMLKGQKKNLQVKNDRLASQLHGTNDNTPNKCSDITY